ncbi:hypothetical protein PENNAL_c0103G08678, partial [Penicillium nalgiovense]
LLLTKRVARPLSARRRGPCEQPTRHCFVRVEHHLAHGETTRPSPL